MYRPHFIDLCQPKINNGYEIDKDTQYVGVDNYTCSGNATENRIREVYLSFPSGHTSYAFQAGIFIILYLQAKFSGHRLMKNTLIIPTIQLLILVAAIYTGISRIQVDVYLRNCICLINKARDTLET